MAPGIITTTDISGSLDAKNIVMGVLTKGIELSNLEVLCPKVKVPELNATIPVSTPAAVTEDVEELEFTEISGAEFEYVSFALKKDRVKLAASDESKHRSKVGDPLSIQIESSGVRLAATLDKKIVTAMETSPQTTAASLKWDTIANNPLVDLQVAVNKILPYKADFVIMPPLVHNDYVGNDFVKDIGAGAPATMKGSIQKIPGVELDVFVNSNVTAKSVLVGSSTGMPAVIGNGPVEVRKGDSMALGAMTYQMDVFRQVVAPVMKTSGSLNMSVAAITAVIT